MPPTAQTETPKKKLGPMNRRRAAIPQQLVEERPSPCDGKLPLVLSPTLPEVSLGEWITSHSEMVEEKLLAHGGILFRGFQVRTPEAFRDIVATASGELLEYTYRSTPRTEVKGHVYTSTEYPADQSIPMHNEMSYTSSWPLKIWFCCLTSARTGGETPIADSRAIYQRLDPALRRRFAEKKVMYVRNYGEGIDLPWQTVFQTEERATVEKSCREKGIDFEWLGEDRLRTRQVAQAVAVHPTTGDKLWFNQAHLFHVTSLPREVLEPLLQVTAEEDLPRNTYYGDGSPIESSALEEIRGVFEEGSQVFPWQEGDVLMLDNMLTAHGRKPFEGARKVVVAMVHPILAEEQPETMEV